MSSYPKKATVRRDGIWFMNDWYWGEDIIPYFRQKVWVRYSENDPSKIYVLDESGCYAGIAYKRNKAYWGMEDKDYAHFNRMKKTTRDAYKGYLDQRMTDSEREAAASSVFPGQDTVLEPDVQEEFLQTKYGPMIEDAKKREQEKKSDEDEIIKFDKKYASMEIQQRDFDAEVDEWALNYGRDIINAIKQKNTND
jgi:hypothetical protein